MVRDTDDLVQVEIEGIARPLEQPTAETVAPMLRQRAVIRPPTAEPPDLAPLAERVAPLLAEAGVVLAGSPALMLRDPASGRVLRFVVGQAEADAIARHQQKVPTPRPMSHDLMRALADTGGLRVERVTIARRDGDTYYASLTLRRRGGRTVEVDARPSDAVNLALRAGAPVYAAADLLQDPPAGELPRPGAAA